MAESASQVSQPCPLVGHANARHTCQDAENEVGKTTMETNRMIDPFGIEGTLRELERYQNVAVSVQKLGKASPRRHHSDSGP